MKKQTRRKFSSSFKVKVVLEAIKAQHTLVEIARKYEVSQVVISRWKAEFLNNAGSVFEKSGNHDEPAIDTQELYAQIGQLRVENEFLKKLQETGSMKDRLNLVRTGSKRISVRRQCELLSVNRSRLYYKPVPEKPDNLKMMEIMDKHLSAHPTEGVVSIVLFFIARGYTVGPKRIPRDCFASWADRPSTAGRILPNWD